jgi:integrase
MQTRGQLSRGRFKDIEEWPEPDRSQWLKATAPSRLIDRIRNRDRVNWRPATRLKVSRGYGFYLNWLDLTGRLSADARPDQRVTLERIDAYCAYMTGKVQPTTIRSRLTDLARAMHVVGFPVEVALARERSYAYPKKGDPLKKRARMQDPGAVLDLGYELMDRAEAALVPTRRHAVLYRDGLQIALLACRALRLGNLTAIKVGVHLNREGCRWRLYFAPEETKGKCAYESFWPEHLTGRLERYLDYWRPMLLDDRYSGPELWISEHPGPMTENGNYYAVTTRTKFGKHQNPHLFRDSLATSIAIHDPNNVRVIPAALNHADPNTGEQYYNQARAADASSALTAATERLRRQYGRRRGGGSVPN